LRLPNPITRPSPLSPGLTVSRREISDILLIISHRAIDFLGHGRFDCAIFTMRKNLFFYDATCL